MKPWVALNKPVQIDVVSPDGQVKSRVPGYYNGSGFVVDDMSIDVSPGDEIRRALPNGREEAFVVDDPKFFCSGPFGPHYQIAVSRKGQFSPHTGGNYGISLSGPNARVNINSQDSSTNVVGLSNAFTDVRSALEKNGLPPERLIEVDTRLAEMAAARDKNTFAKAYQHFVGAVADHITVIAPFLPAITEALSKLA